MSLWARRTVTLAFFIHALKEFFKFGKLFGHENRAQLCPALLPHLVQSRVRLIVNRFRFRMPLQEDAIKLLGLLRRETELVCKLLHAARSAFRFA